MNSSLDIVAKNWWARIRLQSWTEGSASCSLWDHG